MGRGGARSGGVRASPGRARPDALFSAWPWGNNLRPFGPAALQWSSPRPRCWELVPIHDVQALLKTKGNPAGTPAPPEQHLLKRMELVRRGRLPAQQARRRELPHLFQRSVPAFRNVDGAWVGCSVEQRRKAVRAVAHLVWAEAAPPADGYLFHANTTDIQSCGFGRRIPFAGVGCFREGAAGGVRSMAATWLILPVVICLSQRLSHACLSIS